MTKRGPVYRSESLNDVPTTRIATEHFLASSFTLLVFPGLPSLGHHLPLSALALFYHIFLPLIGKCVFAGGGVAMKEKQCLLLFPLSCLFFK